MAVLLDMDQLRMDFIVFFPFLSERVPPHPVYL